MSIDPAVENLYNNRLRVPDFMDTINWWGERSAEARDNLTSHLGIGYGDSDRQFMDVFPARGANAPVLIFIHGGYWQMMDPGFSHFMAPALTDSGYCVVFVGYDLCPDVSVGGITEQVRNACAFVFDHAPDHGGDPSRIFVSGHSAGGHLTAEMYATDWPDFRKDLPADLVKGALPVSGLYDLVPLVNTSINDKTGMTEETARAFSPLHRKPAGSGNLILAFGGDESRGFHDQAGRLADAWSDEIKEIGILNVKGANHFTVVNQLADPDSPLFRAAVSLKG